MNRNAPVRAKTSDSDYSLMEFMKDFPDDATCLEWLWRTRYSPDGETAKCEPCGKTRTFKRYATAQQRQSWTCTTCGTHVHPTAGTIFHKSSTSLHLWFYAMYLMTSTRCGISAKQLEREIGVTYKTAWRMMNLIRNELMFDEGTPLGGTVEMDEAYIGGKRRGSPRGRPGRGSHKTPVFGMVERGGQIAAYTMPNLTGAQMLSHVAKRVLPQSMIYTDEYAAYNGLTARGYTHERVNHSTGVYVSGDVHTNTIEGFWALLKHGIRGVYHSVSAKHLQGYLSEYVWRWNHRDQPAAMFLSLLLRAAKP